MDHVATFSLAELRAAFSYDPDTGILRWSQQVGVGGGRRNAGDEAGRISNTGRRVVSFKGRLVQSHRLIWFIYYGEPPKGFIDHIDRNPLNNRVSNLRLASMSQNNANKGITKKNTSGFKGVSWYPKTGKWRASIIINGKHHSLGLHETKESAYRAYMEASYRHYGDFSYGG